MMRDVLQQITASWVARTFGQSYQDSTTERCLRVIEEATELVQSCGLDEALVHEVVRRCYQREAGNPFQELGGVQVTLLALAENLQISAQEAEMEELMRILDLPAEKFRTSQRRKEGDGLTDPQISMPA